MTYAEYKKNVVQHFNKCIQYCSDTDQQTLADQIRVILHEMEQRCFNIVVCGEIKRGKSSLLTNFLEEELIFPIDIDTCTNASTVVQYGAEEKIEVIFETDATSGLVYPREQITREQIADYVTEQNNENNHKQVNCLNVVVPNTKLKEGFRFFDTPGIGSMNPDHALKTDMCLDSADAVIFVCDTMAPISDSELSFLKRTYTRCQNLLVVLTKADQKGATEVEVIIEDLKNKILQTLEVNTDDLPLVAVSSKAKAKYRATKEEPYLANSNFKAMEAALWKLLYNKRASVVILPYLQELRDVISKRLSSINVQKEALDNDAREIVKVLNEKVNERNERLAASGKWKEEIRHEMQIISFSTQEIIRNGVQAAVDTLDEMYSNKTLTKIDTASLVINNELSDTIRDARRYIEVKIGDLNKACYEKLGLTTDHNEMVLEKIRYNSKEVISVSKVEENDFEVMVQQGRTIVGSSVGMGSMFGVIGAIGGGLLGLFTLGPVGVIAVGLKYAAMYGAAGGTYGTIRGAFNAILKSKNHDLPAIRASFGTYVNQSAQSMLSSAILTNTELTKSMCDDLSEQIQRQVEGIQTTINDIKKNQELTAKEAQEKKEMLNKEGKILTEFIEAARRLSAMTQ